MVLNLEANKHPVKVRSILMPEELENNTLNGLNPTIVVYIDKESGSLGHDNGK
jgi:hypothetical protein